MSEKNVSHEAELNHSRVNSQVLGDLLAAVGNHEAQALLLGNMEPGEIYGASPLHYRLFLKPQGGPPAYRGSVNNQRDWVLKSFVPAGCAVEHPGKQEKFSVTSLGHDQGRALAGHLSELSLETPDISLRSLFGMTRSRASKETRPPVDRLHILELVVTGESLQTSEVEKVLELPTRTVLNNLQWLARHAIISYEGVDTRHIATKTFYKLPDTLNLEVPDRSGPARTAVYETLSWLHSQGCRDITSSDFVAVVTNRHPDLHFEKGLRYKNALRMANDLVKAGDIGKVGFTNDRKSEIHLVPGMEEVVQKVLRITDGMLENSTDFLAEGHTKMDTILEDEEAVRTLVSKAFAASPEANRVPKDIRIPLVQHYLEKGALTIRELGDQLAKHGMTEGAVKNTLREMRADRLVRARRGEDGRNQWFLNSSH